MVFLGEVFQDVDRIVGVDVANALGNGLWSQLFQDFFAHRIVDFGQRGEVEILAQQRDQLGAVLGIEGLDQIAGIGFVQFTDERAQQASVASSDRVRNDLDKFRTDGPVSVAERIRRSIGRRGDVLVVGHAGPREAGLRGIVRLYAGAAIGKSRKRVRLRGVALLSSA